MLENWPQFGAGPYKREQIAGGSSRQVVGDSDGTAPSHYGEGVNIAVLDVHPFPKIERDSLPVTDHARFNGLNATAVAPSATVQFFPSNVDPYRLPTIEHENIVDRGKAFFVQNFTSRKTHSMLENPVKNYAIRTTKNVTGWLKHIDKLNEDDNSDNDIHVITAPIGTSNAGLVKALDMAITGGKLDPKTQAQIFGDTDPLSLGENERLERINAYAENQYATNLEWIEARREYADTAKDASEEAVILFAAGNEHVLIPEEVGADEMNHLVRASNDVLAVGAANDEFNGPATYSSRGGTDRNPDFLTLGRYTTESTPLATQGTSFAVPIAGGIISALLSENPGLTPQQAKERIINSAEAVPGKSEKEVGHGIIADPLSVIESIN